MDDHWNHFRQRKSSKPSWIAQSLEISSGVSAHPSSKMGPAWVAKPWEMATHLHGNEKKKSNSFNSSKLLMSTYIPWNWTMKRKSRAGHGSHGTVQTFLDPNCSSRVGKHSTVWIDTCDICNALKSVAWWTLSPSWTNLKWSILVKTLAAYSKIAGEWMAIPPSIYPNMVSY